VELLKEILDLIELTIVQNNQSTRLDYKSRLMTVSCQNVLSQYGRISVMYCLRHLIQYSNESSQEPETIVQHFDSISDLFQLVCFSYVLCVGV